jgi:thioredoxin-like negative regulator of GroEL
MSESGKNAIESSAVADGGAPSEAKQPKTRFFRKFDWMVAGLTGFIVFLGYFYTLAPNLTLEDSGELAVGSYYAGVPHPPGYPIWTIYTWLFTVLVPVSNIAFRVGLASAVAGACSCGLLALMVSRGSAMIIKGIDSFKEIDEPTEKAISGVSGWVAGMVFGFNGFMWSQAVIVEVYTLSVFSLMGVFVCLMRWMYIPNERKYLYWTLFLFGICFNNHQSLVVAAIGIEIGIAAANPRLGRDLFLGNSIVYVLGLIAKWNGAVTAFDANLPLFIIYNSVGFCSIAAFVWLWSQTREMLTEWKPVVVMLLVWLVGLSFYFYMPLTSSTNPPMNWGYPRTWDGFVHAFTRGQYERTNPTTSLFRFIQQMWLYVKGASQEFNPIILLIALIPFGFFKRMAHRERAWLTGLTGIFFCLAVVLMILLNPPPGKQSQELNRVFFTPSHTILAIWAGYGVSLILALLVAQYREFRTHALLGGSVAMGIALYLWAGLERVHALDKFTAIYLVICVAVFLVTLAARPTKLPLRIVLVVFAVLPLHSVFSHWWKNEKRGHLFGYWFGHDMFKPPYDLYPEMEKNAILFGGTDPGRFNPTYMIFCESFLPPSKKPLDPDFDRRDVYLITQNALADPTYLDYIRAHYYRSAQVDSPFFQEMLRSEDSRKLGKTNVLARLVGPLDRAMSSFGASVEARRRVEGLYPDLEIYTPSVDDSENSYLEYMVDAHRRQQLGQLKPGEIVTQLPDGHVSVQGQAAVMAINGLLTQTIFEKNPDHEFYIEESFPLDWMFPHLSPYGIILKLNREPVDAITVEMMERDREFWANYMERLIGNWIGPETSIEELVRFARRTYLQGDLSEYKGDPKFLREDWAQKAFSKVRSAIAGVYAFRLSPQCPPELRPKTAEEEQRLLEEADLAFRQAFALCPYSPEAILRYSNLLATVNRLDDAILLTRTCYEFDRENQGVLQLLHQLNQMKQGQAAVQQVQGEVDQLERQYAIDSTNLEVTFKLVSKYVALTRTNEALQLLKAIVDNEEASATALLSASGAYMQLGLYGELETALVKLVDLMPDNPEARYDLAGTQALLQKNTETIQNLAKAFELDRARTDQIPGTKSLLARAQEDARFNGIRLMPEFLQLIKGN